MDYTKLPSVYRELDSWKVFFAEMDAKHALDTMTKNLGALNFNEQLSDMTYTEVGGEHPFPHEASMTSQVGGQPFQHNDSMMSQAIKEHPFQHQSMMPQVREQQFPREESMISQLGEQQLQREKSIQSDGSRKHVVMDFFDNGTIDDRMGVYCSIAEENELKREKEAELKTVQPFETSYSTGFWNTCVMEGGFIKH